MSIENMIDPQFLKLTVFNGDSGVIFWYKSRWGGAQGLLLYVEVGIGGGSFDMVLVQTHGTVVNTQRPPK